MKNIFLIIFLSISAGLAGQTETAADTAKTNLLDKFDLHVYGSVLYHNYNWETDTARTNTVDLNHVVFEPEFEINDVMSLEMEIEFEHGGTGSSVEMETGDGEYAFENEIEQGGEVLMEELEFAWHVKPELELKAGKIKVPIGLNNMYYEPDDYVTSTYNSVESAMLPLGWYQIGVGAEYEFGRHDEIELNGVFVNGMDNSKFDSEHWIREGATQPMEHMNAGSFAGALRVDYKITDDFVAGLSGYAGNTTPNRQIKNMGEDAWLTLADAHIRLKTNSYYFQALGLYGSLQNAKLIYEANEGYYEDSVIAADPVPSAAIGGYVEAGVNILPWFTKTGNSSLYVFGGYYVYDTNFKVSDIIPYDPSMKNTEFRGGVSYQWNNKVGWKADFSSRRIHSLEEKTDRTFTTGFTFNI